MKQYEDGYEEKRVWAVVDVNSRMEDNVIAVFDDFAEACEFANEDEPDDHCWYKVFKTSLYTRTGDL